MVSEKVLEKYLIKEVKKRQGKAVKLAGENQVGQPDRMILLPGGRIGFLELKTTGKKPTKLQKHWLNELQDLGFVAGWADNKDDIDAFIMTVERCSK